MSLRDDYAPTISPGPYPRLRLKPHTSAAQTIASLEQLINKAGNVTSHAVGTADVVVDRLRNGYAGWVEQVEDVLHSATYSTDWSSLLFTDRYWHIRDMAYPSQDRIHWSTTRSGARRRGYRGPLMT